eukprot:CAMPEP_0201554612 /NCGR_PEP_ID=MMETSP0173_2-20130828/42658_1 /ASSEMBLY_ACC=CAM_ASM_000268 /TAXON_ID=218659 /ORGANISM="Vexillifera sp., Strain DIVA3 564/2" /LENGTH=365 /DNA_ID=CAMNT_0047965977 /DNA_START=102 /DNA_END=1196 /DNA_ORIENTATION=+
MSATNGIFQIFSGNKQATGFYLGNGWVMANTHLLQNATDVSQAKFQLDSKTFDPQERFAFGFEVKDVDLVVVKLGSQFDGSGVVQSDDWEEKEQEAVNLLTGKTEISMSKTTPDQSVIVVTNEKEINACVGEVKNQSVSLTTKDEPNKGFGWHGYSGSPVYSRSDSKLLGILNTAEEGSDNSWVLGMVPWDDNGKILKHGVTLINKVTCILRCLSPLGKRLGMSGMDYSKDQLPTLKKDLQNYLKENFCFLILPEKQRQQCQVPLILTDTSIDNKYIARTWPTQSKWITGQIQRIVRDIAAFTELGKKEKKPHSWQVFKNNEKKIHASHPLFKCNPLRPRFGGAGSIRFVAEIQGAAKKNNEWNW